MNRKQSQLDKQEKKNNLRYKVPNQYEMPQSPPRFKEKIMQVRTTSIQGFQTTQLFKFDPQKDLEFKKVQKNNKPQFKLPPPIKKEEYPNLNILKTSYNPKNKNYIDYLYEKRKKEYKKPQTLSSTQTSFKFDGMLNTTPLQNQSTSIKKQKHVKTESKVQILHYAKEKPIMFNLPNFYSSLTQTDFLKINKNDKLDIIQQNIITKNENIDDSFLEEAKESQKLNEAINKMKKSNAISQNTDKVQNLIDESDLNVQPEKNLIDLIKQIFTEQVTQNVEHQEQFNIKNSMFINKNVQKVMKDIKNQDDAIQFFANYSTLTPIKYLFFIKEKQEFHDFKPYELTHVSYSQIMKQQIFYVISSRGVVELQNKPVYSINQDYTKKNIISNIVSLSEWVKQQSNYHILCKLSFFTYFFSSKIFKKWKMNINLKLFKFFKDKLYRKCFMVRINFIEPIKQIFEINHKIQTEMVISQEYLNQKGVWDINQFLNDQAVRRKEIQKNNNDRIQELIEQIKSFITVIFQSQILNDQDFIQSYQIKQNQPFIEKEKNNKPEDIIKKTKSLVHNKIEKIKIQNLFKQNKIDLSLLQVFIKFVDNSMRQNIYISCLRSVEILLQNILMDRTKIGGMFKTFIQYQDNKIDLSPNQDHIFSSIQKCVVENNKVLTNTYMIQNIAEFSKVLGPYVSLKIQKLLNNSQNLQNKLQAVKNKIDLDFEKALQFIQLPVTRCKDIIRQYNQFQDPIYQNDILQKVYTNQQNREEINELQNQLQIISYSLKDTNKGTLYIMGYNFRNKLQSYINQKMEYFKQNLYIDLRNLSQRLFDDLQKYEVSISILPVELKDFVSFIGQLNALKEQMVVIEDDQMSLESSHQLFKLVDPEMIKIVDQNQLISIQANIYELRRQIIQAENYASIKQQENEKIFQQSYQNLQKFILRFQKAVDNEPLIPNQEITYEFIHKISNSMKFEIENWDKQISTFRVEYGVLQDYKKVMKEQFVQMENFDTSLIRYLDRKMLWKCVMDLSENIYNWQHWPVHKLSTDVIEKTMEVYNNTIQQLRFRISNLNSLGSDQLFNYFQNLFQDFNQTMPLLLSLSNKDLQERHYQEIFQIFNKEYIPNFNHKLLIDLGAEQKKEKIDEISIRATGEFLLEKQLASIENKWDSLCFTFADYNDGATYKLVEVDDIMSLIDDNIISIQSMLATRFVKNIRAKVLNTFNQLRIIQKNIDKWMLVQKNWIYLEGIFKVKDLSPKLLSELDKFKGVDKFFKEHQRKSQITQLVRLICGTEDLFYKLTQNNKVLEGILGQLNRYLDQIRQIFPRFYMISNLDLIQITSLQGNIQMIQPHLKKVFENVNQLKFSQKVSLEVQGLISIDPNMEPETIIFPQGPLYFNPNDRVEQWFIQIENQMIQAVHDQTEITLKHYPNNIFDKEKWIMGSYPAQCQILAEMIKFQEQVSKAFQKEEIDQMMEVLAQYTTVGKNLVDVVRKDLTLSKNLITCNLLIINVNLKNVVQYLLENSISKCTEFAWQKQLKFYWNYGDSLLSIEQTFSKLIYSYEYLGNTQRLVMTPLTNACYLTMTSALHMQNFGLPNGPAGTGKTETIKDLAKAIGQQCVIFNCSESLDFLIVGKFLTGIAQQGNWICFDEFNRINIENLSVITQQMIIIQEGLRSNDPEVYFEGTYIKIKKQCGIFATINPSYEGRTELPDELKSLFRPIAMMLPDMQIITEILFLTSGFITAQILSQKTVQIFYLLQEQLSRQQHYDFGMRALKLVLQVAGNYFRKADFTSEQKIIVQAFYASYMPKLVENDIQLFVLIMKDYFPNVTLTYNDKELMDDNFAIVGEKLGYHLTERFIEKIQQFDSILEYRNGVIILGQSMDAKSTLLNIFVQSKNKVDDQMNYEIQHLNPKALDIKQLYGYTNEVTSDWMDGIISQCIKDILDLKIGHEVLLHCDGPIDPIWIENLNTVLDDSKILCLANGQRIKLPSNFKIVFEVDSVKNASPATISRCGVIFMGSNILSGQTFANYWTEHFIARKFNLIIGDGKKVENNLTREIRDSINKINDFVQMNFSVFEKENNQFIPMNQKQVLLQCFNVFEAYFNTYKDFVGDIQKLQHSVQTEMEIYFKMITVFSLIWGMGKNYYDQIDPNNKKKLSQLLKQKVLKIFISFPIEGDVFEFYLNFQNMRVAKWTELIKEYYDYTQHYTSFFTIMIQTSDTFKYSNMISLYQKNNLNTLVLGDQSCGKTLIVQNIEKNLPKTHFGVQINFSTLSSINNVIQSFFNKNRFNYEITLCQISTINDLKCVLFIDNVNLPLRDSYESQPTSEIIRQLISTSRFYDPKKLKQIDIQKPVIVGITHSSQPLPNNRMCTHFIPLNINQIEIITLQSICQTLIFQFLRDANIAPILHSVCSFIIAVYETCQQKLQMNKVWYNYKVNDVIRVAQSLKELIYVQDSRTLCVATLHECLRVFGDRVTDKEDLEIFNRCISENANTKFSIDDTQIESILNTKMCHFTNKKQRYEIVDQQIDIQAACSDQQQFYNMNHKIQMNLIFFDQAIDHFLRICRILKSQRGNALLLGLIGNGKTCLTKLAAFIYNISFFEIDVKKGYDNQKWSEDVKSLLKMTGSKMIQNVFMINDQQLVLENQLQDLDNILNYGEASNLFIQEDYDEVFVNLKLYIKDRSILESQEKMMDIFFQNVRKNLHIVFNFSPFGDKFRDRLNQFPSLTSHCTIDYYDDWPEGALVDFALKSFKLHKNLGIGQIMNQIAILMVHVHKQTRSNAIKYFEQTKMSIYITPGSFLQFINQYIELMIRKMGFLPQQLASYQDGLQIIKDTQREILKMQAKIREFQPQAIKAFKENEILQNELNTKTKDIEVTKKQLETATAEATVLRDVVFTKQQQLTQETEQLQKLMKQCMQALQNIEKQQIVILKSYINPPSLVQLVVCAVCVLFEISDNWEDAKKFLLGDIRFLEKLKSYVVVNKQELFETLRSKYIASPEWIRQNVANQSEACLNIFDWLMAIDELEKIQLISNQKDDQLKQINGEFLVIEAHYQEKKTYLEQIQGTQEKLVQQVIESNKKAFMIRSELTAAQKALVRAEKLQLLLNNEEERWNQNTSDLKQNLAYILGNCLISAAVVIYLGPFSSGFRSNLIEDFIETCRQKKIPINTELDITKILGTEQEIIELFVQGLPKDKQAVQNSLIMKNNPRWPLLHDPQLQAKKWLLYEDPQQFTYVTQMDNPQLFKGIENAVQCGYFLIVMEMNEKISPLLDNLISRNFYKKQMMNYVAVGQIELPIHDNFKLCIVCEMENPFFSPEVQNRLCIINFCVNVQSLEEQLLFEVIKQDKNHLEIQRKEIISQINKDQTSLIIYEQKILEIIQRQKNEILNNDEVINAVEQTQQINFEIRDKMNENKQICEIIEKSREEYRIIAKQGNIIYYTLIDLGKIEPYYYFTLDFFLKYYLEILQITPPSEKIDIRVQSLLENLNSMFFRRICRSLFEKDKIIFAFLIKARMELGINLYENKLWLFYLIGGHILIQKFKTSVPSYLNVSQWRQIEYLLKIDESAAKFKQQFEIPDLLQPLMNSHNPFNEILPEIKPFTLICLIKTINIHSTYYGVQYFIGDTFKLNQGENDLEEVLTESKPTEPILFIAGKGCNLNQPIKKLAEKAQKEDLMVSISLGAGTGQAALQRVVKQAQQGEWILIQNLHLEKSWFEQLQAKMNSDDWEEPKNGFKLFLSINPVKNIPYQILQSCYNVTMERTKGLQQNMKIAYNKTQTASHDEQKPQLRQITYILTYFHNRILQRKDYDPLGWNFSYDWIQTDLQASIFFAKESLQRNNKLDLEALNSIIACILYGGRVNDEIDQRTIQTMLRLDLESDFKLNNVAQDHFRLTDIRSIIRQISPENLPEQVGLHKNAQVTFENEQFDYFKHSLKQMSVFNETTIKINKKKEMLDGITLILDTGTLIDFQFFIQNDISVLQLYKCQEQAKFNILIQTIRDSLVKLYAYVIGKISFNQELEQIIEQIFKNEIPKIWLNVSYFTQYSLGSYIQDLKKRILFFKNWVSQNLDFYIISYFYIPNVNIIFQGFFTSIRQQFSRNRQVPLDLVDFIYKLQPKDYRCTSMNEGANIQGLYIQGCSVDTKSLLLVDQNVKKVFQVLPTLTIFPEYIEKIPILNIYACPLYKNKKRRGQLDAQGRNSNYVRCINLSTKLEEQLCVVRGVAMFCSVSD